MHLGEQLRAYRRKRRVTQRDLAADVGCSAPSICRRETGETGMSMAELLELCAAVERVREERERSTQSAEVLTGSE